MVTLNPVKEQCGVRVQMEGVPCPWSGPERPASVCVCLRAGWQLMNVSVRGCEVCLESLA